MGYITGSNWENCPWSKLEQFEQKKKCFIGYNPKYKRHSGVHTNVDK